MTLHNWDGRISWSKASTYDRCPRQFYFKYVADDVEPDEGVDTTVRDQGIEFHDYMDKYYEVCPTEPNKDSAITLAKEMFDEERQAKYREWIRMWHQFNEWLYEKWGEEHWRPIETEYYVDEEIEGHEHGGYIDAIHWDPIREEYGVIDYKPTARDNSRIKGQTAYYGEILLEADGLLDMDVEWAGCYGYTDGRYQTWDIHWASTRASRRKIKRLIELDNGYEPNFGPHCDWCDYYASCWMKENDMEL